MAKVTFIEHDGSRSELEGAPGTSVMKVAVANGVDAIVAECGGSMSCATCHVYLEKSAPGQFPEPLEGEDFMLDDTACERQPNSRLSCQLILTDDIDEVVVQLPERQM